MLGYLYQCRQALLLALEESKTQPGLRISIERFDDIAFERGETPIKQLQLKHHGTAANLGDMSVDLWKTLRIWSEQVAANSQLPFERRFVIITTATAAAGSAISKLRAFRESSEDEAQALEQLRAAASSSTNSESAIGRLAFLALSDQDQRNLLSAVQIYDAAPTITDVRSDIEHLLSFAAPEKHISSLVDHLEGWWFNQIVASLSDEAAPAISLLTVRQKLDEIASAFRSGDLLLSDDAQLVSTEDLSASDGRIFVRQMRCVDIAEAAIELAKRDYYRATAQRSAWARENVLLDGEAQRYDDGLVDRWERERLAREGEGAPVSDDEKRRFGRELFHWAARAQASFRNRHEQWLCSGSYQMLADQVSVGWHPEHQNLFGQVDKDRAA